MSTPPAAKAPPAAMKHIWGLFRTWDATAIDLKSKIARWRNIVLALTVAGTVVAALSQQSGTWSLTKAWTLLPNVLGVTAGIALALAAFFTREALKPSAQSEQVRARSAAEGFKTEAYLLAAHAPPYDDPANDRFAKAARISEAVKDLARNTLTNDEKLVGVLPESLTVDEYITARVDNEINNFYVPQAKRNAAKVKKAQGLGFALSALSVVLGAVSALFGWVAGWITVIGTVVATIMAYQSAGRFQFLVVSYQATAERLDQLKTRWEDSQKTETDKADRDKFILACEEAISIENSAWMAEWTKAGSKS